MRTVLLSAAALALAGCVSVDVREEYDAPGMTNAEAKAIVEAANAEFEARFAANDAEGLAALYTTTARVIPPDAPDQVGREAIAAYWGGAVAALGTVKLTTVEAVAVGPGYIAERSHVTLYTDDGTVAGGGKATLIYAYEDGAWKMQWDSWNTGPTE
jgi:ketosteroid isomerase-like protein